MPYLTQAEADAATAAGVVFADGVARGAVFGTEYLGQIGTRTRFPNRVKTDFQQGMWRQGDFIREDVTSLRVIYPNFYKTSTGEGNPGFALTITASIEYPAGTFTRVTFNGGATSATMADGTAALISDPVAIAIPRGAQIFYNTWTSGTGYIYSELGYRAASGDKVSVGATVTDSTMATFTGTGAGLQFGPSAVIATTRRPSVALVGDSRVEGIGTANDAFAASNYIGELAPGIAPYFAILDTAKGGFSAQNITAGGFTKRAQYLQYVSHGVIELGINDFAVGRTVAQVQSDRAYIRSLAPTVKWFETTITPRSTSTVAISSLTSSGTTATAVIPAANAAVLSVGQSIAVAGATPAGYNGTVVITAIAGPSISYTLLAGATGLAAASPTGTMSDLWNSQVFQTASGLADPNRVNFNETVRAGVPGVEGYLELADGAESFRNSGKWKTPPQAPAIMTLDGLHGNTVEWTETQKAINPALIRR
jgi:hypothetical protein